MKNEEIVRALRCISTAGGENACEHCPYWKEEEVPEEERPIYGADTMHSCDVDRCARYAEEIAVAQEKTRWIPVTERLPDQCVDVLVRYRDKHILMGTARCDDWLDEDLEDGVITHWMRMPKGPEEE